jgi:hypothetical protein
MTLLAEAQQLQKTQPARYRGNRQAQYPEILQLAVAVIAGEVSISNATRALYPGRKNPDSGWRLSTESLMFRAMQQAIRSGNYTFSKNGEPDAHV